MNTETGVILGILLLLIIGNVYQYQNPRVVEVPMEQTEIDSTAWVARSAYASRGSIIDSLETRNQALAQEVEEMGDEIISFTEITGELRLQVDSLENEQASWNAIPFVDLMNDRDSAAIADTLFSRTETFGDGLFSITATAEFRDNQFRLDILPPTQLRPIRLSVTNTMNEDQSRVLNYVESPDFSNLEYQSFTELEPERELPRFWIGVGVGASLVLGSLILLN